MSAYFQLWRNLTKSYVICIDGAAEHTKHSNTFKCTRWTLLLHSNTQQVTSQNRNGVRTSIDIFWDSNCQKLLVKICHFKICCQRTCTFTLRQRKGSCVLGIFYTNRTFWKVISFFARSLCSLTSIIITSLRAVE